MAQYQKTTLEMENNLDSCDNIESFLAENQERFLDVNASQFLAYYLKKKKLSKAALIRDSGLNQVYAYQIFSGLKHPDRDKLICIAIAAGMTVEETDHLLASERKSSLYPRIVRDALIEFALNHHYTVAQTDDLLYDHDCKTLLNE